ncbi:MAG: helix-turn-helix transcriptional regulator [Solirubrobacteraceae bacterium]
MRSAVESDVHPAPGTATSTAFAGSSARSALLERERVVTTLRTVIGEAAGGQSRVVVVEGEGGIGKTRLLAEARRLAAEADLRVLGARGGELEREFAFGVVRQLFEPGLAGSDASALHGAAAAARAVFELGDGQAGVGQGDDPSFASLHGLYWLTANLSAEAPLVLVVDDLHWCDSPSLRFLAYLVRRLEGLSVLVICTMRPAERVDAAPLGEIIGDPLTVSIHPAALSGPAAAQLVRERLGETADDAFGTACHTATGGNPLLLHELLKTLEGEGVRPDAAHVATVADLGPRAASHAVLVRLARLSEEAVKLAAATAVLGDDAELSTVAALAGINVEQAGEPVAELIRAEVLRERSPLGFVHPLVGAAVYRDLSTVERALAHDRAARLLAAGGAAAERVAAHLLASPPRGEEWVVESLTRAARSSLHKGAADSAVAYLARALREPPPVERRATLLLELGRAETLTSGTAAVAHLSEAYELLGDSHDRAVAAQMLGRTLLLTGRPAEGASVASGAAAQLPAELDDLRSALEALELIAVVIEGTDNGALGRLERHRKRPVGGGVGAKMLAAVAVHEWMVSGGPCEACAELALEALAGGELIAADNGLLAVTAILVLTLADREEALEAWEVSLADAHRRGSLLSKKSVTLWRGFTMYWRGELAEAEESMRSYAEGRTWGLGPVGRLYSDAVISAVLRERGDLVAARRVLEGSTDPGDRGDATRCWLHSQLQLLVAEGRFDEALAVSASFASRFAQLVNPVDTPWRVPTAVALSRVGRADEARTLAAQEHGLARRWGAPGTVARALRLLATLEHEDGLDLLSQAAGLAAGSPARLEHAKALAALGAALRRARRPTDAREPLRRALELADVLGAAGLAEQVRSELYAAGGRPRTTALGGVEALTPSERRVAALAVGGQTNREIAQELFVTPKTIELHLGNVYRKLGVRSRRELPAGLKS